MRYYKLAIVGNSISPLTYGSFTSCRTGEVVLAPLKNTNKRAVVLKEVEKPNFKCKPITEKLPLFYSQNQLQCADFIYKYYVSSIGESLKLFTPFSSLHELNSQKINWGLDFSPIKNTKNPELNKNETKVPFSNIRFFTTKKSIKLHFPNGAWALAQGENLTLLALKRLHGKHKLICGWEFISTDRLYNSKIQVGLKPRPQDDFTVTKQSLKPYEDKTPLSLSTSQLQAIEFIEKNPRTLLFGDTGSGKTEVYIHQMKKALKNGGNIIFLMPEISLTPQMKKRLTHHFGDLVTLWHSKVSKKRKDEILHEVEKGNIRIIAGARSALFLPIKDISLIIVDEEHDESYKSSSNPRYNAKDVSLMYAKILSARIILGSATPSLTSFHKIPYFRLKGTFFKSKKTYFYENAQNQITPNLLNHLHEVTKQNKQAIVFVPTRANFKYLSCKSCSYTIKCPYCDVGMSLHSFKNALVCHYCNYTSAIPKVCPNCGDDMLEANRIGTVEVAKILSETFEDKNVGIFDKDAVGTETKLKKILKDFNDKKIDILVGTQMLSKGHDYHDVALSVVLGLDNMLNQPDFKAKEKALSLAIQIAGRSGRKGEGRVYIQTKNAEFFNLYMEEYEKFLLHEVKFRKNLYPPFKKLLRMLISHKNESVCINTTNDLVKILKSQDVEIVGYGKSALTKIASKYRYEILLRSDSAKKLIQTAFLCKLPNVQIDMDPLSFS